MATEDDMKRCAEAGVALAGAMAKRAKEAAELLFGARHQAGRETKQRAGRLAKDAKSTAADVVATLRRELSALLVEMEHLEGALRGGPPEPAGTAAHGEAAAPVEPVVPRRAPESAERGAPPAPARRRPAAARNASTAKKASPARKAPAAGKVSAARKVPAAGRKAPTPRGSAPRRTRTNRTGPPPGQG